MENNIIKRSLRIFNSGSGVPRREIAYNTIKDSVENFGRNKKVEMHIHTPASHDYKLYSNKSEEYYKKLTNKEILDIAVNEELLKETNVNELLTEIKSGKNLGQIYTKNKEIGENFKSVKEYISYLMIVHRLVKNNVEIAIICDHNTIKSFNKLKIARKEYLDTFKNGKRLDIFLGVEMSCADMNHLICIFNHTDYENVSKYLGETINSEIGGTYKTSLHVLQEVNQKFDCITYLAHLDTSNIFKGMGIYKKELFNYNSLKNIGLSDYSKRDEIINKLQKIIGTEKKFNFIQDGDSHSLDELAKKSVWIKFSNVNFDSLKKAFYNFSTCILNDIPQNVKKYIKGIYIIGGKSGFLSSKPSIAEDFFSINFSKDLNCIIGGRGTGKSTILKFIEMAFTSNAYSMDDLRSVSRHQIMFIVYHYNDNDYILEFSPQRQIDDNKIQFSFGSKYDKIKDAEISLSKQWTRIFKIKNGFFEEVADKNCAEDFFRRGYSINRLVNNVQNASISETIKNIVIYGIDLEKKDKRVSDFLKDGRKYNINNIIIILKILSLMSFEREKIIVEKIKGFNILEKNKLKIIYNHHFSTKKTNIDYIFTNSYGRYIDNTVLTWDDALSMTKLQIEKIGIVKYLTFLFNKEYNELEKICSIKSVKDEFDTYAVEAGRNDIDSIQKINNIYDIIQKRFFDRKDTFKNIIRDALFINDNFNIMFNVENKETSRVGKTEFKLLEEMSLGQQVAALLTFIIEFGEYVGDDTPLIIDQPEDNLDNQYIYKNLVESLKKIKNKRQVIIATHNSTIVTNSNTEQVIILESDNIKGWVKNSGYPTERKVMEEIINNLEGGITSFKHKLEMYSTILPNKFK